MVSANGYGVGIGNSRFILSNTSISDTIISIYIAINRYLTRSSFVNDGTSVDLLFDI